MRILLLALCFLPMLASGQTDGPRSITVRGESVIDIEPDRIDLTITFWETENLKKENELQIKEQEMIKLLKALSIDLKKLSIDNLAASRYGYGSSSNKVRMSKVFILQLDKIELIDTLLLKLFEIGASNVSVTNLHSNKLEEMKLEATKIALDKAKVKAKTMAEHSGYAIGKIIEISEYTPETTELISRGNYEFQYRVGVASGVNRGVELDNQEIGIRKIRVRYIVDVKYELK